MDLHRESPDLKILCLCSAVKVNDAALKAISAFEHLKELNLDGAGNQAEIDSHASKQRGKFGEQSPQRHTLETFTDAGIAEVLNNCREIEKLDLSNTGITKATLELIAGLDNIKFLRLSNCYELDDEDIEDLLMQRPDLKIIEDSDKSSAADAFEALKEGTEKRFLCRDLSTPQGASQYTFTINPGAKDHLFVDVGVYF